MKKMCFYSKQLYKSKVLIGLSQFVDFLQNQNKYYRSIYIPKQADVSVNLDIKRFALFSGICIQGRQHQ